MATSTTKKKSTSKKRMTILTAIRETNKRIQKSGKLEISENEALRVIRRWGKMSKEQACLFAVFVVFALDDGDFFNVFDLQMYLGFPFSEVLEYVPVLEDLVARGFFVQRFNIPYVKGSFTKDVTVSLPEAIEEQLSYNRPFTPYFPSPMEDKADVLSYLFRVKMEPLSSKITKYVNLIQVAYKDVKFLNRFLPGAYFETKSVLSKELALLFFTIAGTGLLEAPSMPVKDVLDLMKLERPDLFTKILRNFKEEKNFFIKEGTFAIDKTNIADSVAIRWGEKAKRTIFAGDTELLLSTSTVKELGRVKASEIVEKNLFYNKENVDDVDRLERLLEDEKYNEIRKRLEEKAMPKTLSILLYGAPGTGKTETVMQLARKTGRDVFHVNIEEIRSCWVGESEKNTKAIFQAYKACKATKKPILLFNEADAIVSKRTKIEDSNAAVTKMENAIQNILLEEMETFDGIIVLTTNLEQHLDEAFDRRILFKLKFDYPSLDVRQKIWKNKISNLSDANLKVLATDYNFSGAQIENIRRKIALEEVLNGKLPDFETIKGFCSREELFKENRSQIGFR